MKFCVQYQGFSKNYIHIWFDLGRKDPDHFTRMKHFPLFKACPPDTWQKSLHWRAQQATPHSWIYRHKHPSRAEESFNWQCRKIQRCFSSPSKLWFLDNFTMSDHEHSHMTHRVLDQEFFISPQWVPCMASSALPFIGPALISVESSPPCSSCPVVQRQTRTCRPPFSMWTLPHAPGHLTVHWPRMYRGPHPGPSARHYMWS